MANNATGNAIQSAYTGSTGPALLPSGDTTGAKDFAAITAALALGQPVRLGAGTFWVNQVIQVPANATMIGAGSQLTFIMMAAGANLAAVAASTGWTASTNTSSLFPDYIRGIAFDGNTSHQTSGTGHGLVLQTFESYIEDCVFQNTRGDGLRFDSRGANGTTALGNTAVENRVVLCRAISTGGTGFNVNDPTNNTITDGWMLDNVVATAGARGINIDASAGWLIDGNHVYNTQFSAIVAGSAFETRIIANYVEDYGQSTTTGTYAAIDLAGSYFMNDGGNGSAITGNTFHLNNAPGSASTTMSGIAAEATTAGIGTLAITGNVIDASDNTFPANYAGITLSNQASSSSLNATLVGNQFFGNWGAGNLVQNVNGGAINLNQLDSAGAIVSNGNQPALTVQTSANVAFTTGFNVLAPSLSAVGRDLLFNLGVSATSRNAASWSFEYNGVGSNSNLMKFNFFGTAVFLSITAAGVITTLNNTLDDSTGNATFTGNVDISTAGKGLQVKEGSNAKQGTAVLNGTTNVVVANTSVTANSRIFLTHQSNSGTPGVPYVTARTAGTSFTIVSTAASDLGTVAYEIFEPG